MASTPMVNRPDSICRGLLEEICPEVFRRNDRDFVGTPKPAGAPEEKIQEASARCPAPGIPWE
jgi:ferredoxin